MGGYLLARGRNLSSPLSMMVALVTALNGWIICWGATDWFGALGAFAWFPWAWWGLERALDSRRSRWRFLWPAPFVYLLVTGGFPYTVLMLAVLAAWLSLKSLGQTRSLSSIWPLVIGLVLGFGLSAPAWLALFDYVRGSAREAQDSAAHFQWLVPASSLPAFILPNWTVKWADFSTRLMPHTATEMACGLVPPIALLAGLATCGRALVRQIKWELGLLVLVLIISMLPSANVFRWSFRWLPFLHVILALCAAEALQMLRLAASGEAEFDESFRAPGVLALLLVTLTAAAMWMLRVEGPYAWPFAAIVIGLAAVWAAMDVFSFRLEQIRAWTPPVITGAVLLATYLCIPPNCGVPKYNLDQKLTESAPLDPERLYLSVYPAPEFAYRLEKNRNLLGRPCASAAPQCGAAFICSMATARSGRRVWRGNSISRFTARFALIWATRSWKTKADLTANWRGSAWTGSSWPTSSVGILNPTANGSWPLRRKKAACSIGAAKRWLACVP